MPTVAVIGLTEGSRYCRSLVSVSPFDRVRLAALFRRHRVALVRYVTRYTGDHDAAEDIVQEVFVRLRERPPPENWDQRGWLFRVATNMALDRLKVDQRRQQLVEQRTGHLPGSDAPIDASDEMVRQELRARVQRGLQMLVEKERTALLMREEGFSHREIAAAVGTTTKSVGTLIARSLEKLAKELGDGGTHAFD